MLSDDPGQWYRDALRRKHEVELRALLIGYWAPKACVGVVILLLAVIAVRF